jgi:hypothetical protein
MQDASVNGKHTLVVEGDMKVSIADDGIVAVDSSREGRVLSASIAVHPAAERRLVWKFDLRILPTLAVMYLFNALVSQ